MPWSIKKIATNGERAGQAVRGDLEAARLADTDGGKGYGAAATATEQALQAFGNINGFAIEVETAGDIATDGRGYLTISLRTIDPGVMVG